MNYFLYYLKIHITCFSYSSCNNSNLDTENTLQFYGEKYKDLKLNFIYFAELYETQAYMLG